MQSIHPFAPWTAALAFALSLGGAVQAQSLPQPQAAASAPLQPKPFEVTIAHQDSTLPMRVLIESGELEKASGYKIHWRLFGGGGDVLKAMAAGEVQIGEAASTALAQAASQSQNQEFKLFWILNEVAQAEALVARKGSNIAVLKDLKGKRVGTPFGSTAHYQLMAALKQEGIERKDVDIQNMRPQEIVSAWRSGDIDAAFIWDPVLTKIKYSEKTVKVSQTVAVDQFDKTGKKLGKLNKTEMVDKIERVPNTIIATSGGIAKKGFPAFEGLAVDSKWAAKNEAFMLALVQALAKADDDYRKNGAKWTLETPQLKTVARITRADDKDVAESMGLFKYPTLAEQASPAWLGVVEPKPAPGAGGAAGKAAAGATPVWSSPVAGGAAKALADTAAFLKALGRVQEVKGEYRYYVTDAYVKKALAVK